MSVEDSRLSMKTLKWCVRSSTKTAREQLTTCAASVAYRLLHVNAFNEKIHTWKDLKMECPDMGVLS